MSKLIIIDGNSIANRAFYALPLLSNAKGQHTNAVYGFTTMLLRLLEEEQPTHFLVAFDAGKVTFRHEQFKDYKAGRSKTPPELSEQFPLIKQLLESFSITQFELEGYEADDIIGTLTRLADESKKIEVLVVTGDKDMLQLASGQVTIALTRKGISEVEKYDPAEIQAKYGLTPSQIIDLKGLMGDASDNIPGIQGIGEKTGLKLLHEYGSVEEVLNHVEDLKGKMKERVREHKEAALMSKQIATIFREVPMEAGWDTYTYNGYDEDKLVPMFQMLEFKSLLERLNLKDTRGEEQADASLECFLVEETNWHGLESKIKERSIQTLHVEIAGDNPHQSEIVGLSLHHEDQSFYVAFDLLEKPSAQFLVDWLADESAMKHVYDVHKADVALTWHGFHLKGVEFDILLTAYLLDPTESNQTLHALARKYNIAGPKDDDEVFGKGAKFSIPSAEILTEHLGRKAGAISALVPLLKDQLTKSEMNDLFYNLELPLAQELARMESFGVLVDREKLEAYGKELGSKLDELMHQIYKEAGIEFNINSPKQLGEILFEKLELPVQKKTKTGYSTDAEVLERLEPYHPIIGYILHYRQLSKLQSTYIEGLLKEIHVKTKKVHTYFRQTIAATGRLSSQYPNLQNIPIRLEEGRKIRQVFVPSEPEWVILAADYSQIELRILAHISEDPGLIDAFKHDMDIHTKTAMDVFGVTKDQVDSNMRRQAKAVNFGIVYGISDYGLSQNLGITRKEAGTFIDQYFQAFTGVRKYMDEIVKQAKQDGYVSTMLNRRRYLPEINASNFNLRSFAERTAMNTPIQGSAADIIKSAMVQMAERMKEAGVQSRMLLQVHDELVFEVPSSELEQMKQLVTETMESAVNLNVPLKVDVSVGSNWYEAK
jgi:DNA polymerase-1